MRLPTASKLSLASQCTYPWSPNAPKPAPFTKSQASELGDAIHLLAQRIAEGDSNYADGISPEAMAYEGVIRESIASLPDGERFYELPLAWDVATKSARLLPSNGQRDYRAKKPTEIVGTADVVVVCQDYALIRDYKSGRGAREDSSANSGQLRMLALAACRVFGLESAVIELDHLDPGERYPDPFPLDCFQLMEVEEELDRIYTEIASSQQTPRSGAHCYKYWCDVRDRCPATQATLAAIDQEAHRHLPAVPVIENDEQARRVRVGLKLIDEKLKTWKDALQDYVLHNGAVEVGDGVWYGAVEKEREVIAIGHEHLDLLVSMMGSDAARDSIELKSSKAAIENACKVRQTKRGEGLKVARSVFDELRSHGAMKTSRFTTYSDFRKNDNDNNDNEAA